MDPNIDPQLFGPSEVIVVHDEGFDVSTKGLDGKSDPIEHFKDAADGAFVQKSKNVKTSGSTKNKTRKALAERFPHHILTVSILIARSN